MAKPISEDIRIAPAVVMPLPKLIRIFWKGETSVIADWFSVPILPSQKVSVRLYYNWYYFFLSS